MKKLMFLFLILLIPSLSYAAPPIRTFSTTSSDGVGAFSPPNTYTYNVTLTANTGRSLKWPVGAKYFNISSASPFWFVADAALAAAPTADALDGTGSILSPSQRNIPSGSTYFSLISATTQTISIEFWK